MLGVASRSFRGCPALVAATLVCVCAVGATQGAVAKAPMVQGAVGVGWSDCGGIRVDGDGPGAYVMQAKGMSCAAAGRKARRGTYSLNPYGWTIPGWTCRVTRQYAEGSFTRCRLHHKIIRVKAGA